MVTLDNSGVLRIIPLLAMIVYFCSFADGKIIYVGNDVQADFNNIQAGIDAAIDGDIVLVAPGTYTGEGNRDIDFNGKAITVRSIDPNDPNIVASTIIDCEQQGRGFNFHSGEGIDSVICGLTVTGGKTKDGSGIFIRASSPTIKYCNITGNSWDGEHGFGGGFHIKEGYPVISHCTISDNSTDWNGGGIFSNDSSPIITDCTITTNRAFNEGGGICCWDGNVLISNCLIEDNTTSRRRGGGITCRQSDLTITNCIIADNIAGNTGGGIWLLGANTKINQCTITVNSAENMAGGIYFELGNAIIVNCIIENNDAPNGPEIAVNSWLGVIAERSPYPEPYPVAFLTISYSNITSSQNGVYVFNDPGWFSLNWGMGNIDTDPLFADQNNGDYHLKSQAGRWDPNSQSWIYDDVTSPCIDAGDPNSPIGSEPFPNGGIINMGAYGGTAEACKSLIGTSTYAFVSEQSTILQTGGIAGVNWTYTLSGQLQLTVNFGEGKARFSNIDATATDNNEPDRKLDPNDVFNLTSLTGTIGRNGSIRFTGKADDGSDIILDVTLSDEWISLKGQTTPPPNSADFFIFDLDASAQRKYGGGTGEPNNPYLIYTAEHLNALGAEPNDWYKHFKLMADIDLAGYSYDHALIAPDIDTDEYYFQGTPFAGVFDGNGHKISHLKITGVSCLGLFGELAYGAELKDLGVTDVNISGSGDFVGGLLGRNSWGAVVTRCYSTGMVSGDDDIGGLVGSNHGNITQCYSTSAASGDYIIGGLLGGNEREATLTNCYSTGPVNGNDALGGLLGFNLGEVTNCYCAGMVTGNQRVGGLVGWNYGAIASNFWDIQTSGRTNMCGSQEESASGCDDSSGLTTVEMQTASTFLDTGWDFVDETANGTEDIWWIREGQDYPRLWWENDGN